VLSGRGLCDELITRTEESYRLCCVVVCDLETSRIGAPYIYDISRQRVKLTFHLLKSWAMNVCSDTQLGKLHYIINHKRLRVIRPTGISCRLFDHLVYKRKPDFARCIHF